jgi:hypothetical protein
MPQIFHRSIDTLARAAILGGAVLAGVGGYGLWMFYHSNYVTGAEIAYVQPVPFSHLHHVSQLGIDCRYCHTSVETSSFAGMPPTKTCMNCHQEIWFGSATLEPVRASYRTDQSIPWERTHNLPDFVYFNHSIHVNKGVGCVSCHGRVDAMPLMWQHNSLLMEWCLDCHRRPENFVRPKSAVFNLEWRPSDEKDADGKSYDQARLGAKLVDEYKVRSLITCSTCHR